MGWFHKPSTQDALGLSQYILEQLNIVFKDDLHKFIAETYDGAARISSEKKDVQVIIKEKYLNAHFTIAMHID